MKKTLSKQFTNRSQQDVVKETLPDDGAPLSKYVALRWGEKTLSSRVDEEKTGKITFLIQSEEKGEEDREYELTYVQKN